jgi:hypothetical protein
MRHAAAWLGAALLGGAVALHLLVVRPVLQREAAVTRLDPAQIRVLRTPGGMLEVATLERVEEFAWKSSWEACQYVPCPGALKPTVSQLRVRVHYTYRIPLAAEWKLVPRGAADDLAVPAPQLKEPVAFSTSDLELRTERGWFSPGSAENRERLLRELGPELARRGRQPQYLEAQRGQAARTVEEFARRWMQEQKLRADRPLRVMFDTPAMQD